MRAIETCTIDPGVANYTHHTSMGNSNSSQKKLGAGSNFPTDSGKVREPTRQPTQIPINPTAPARTTRAFSFSFFAPAKKEKNPNETTILQSEQSEANDVKYTWAYGRRKIANYPYVMPNDFEEIDR